jgi:hypothetical protein
VQTLRWLKHLPFPNSHSLTGVLFCQANVALLPSLFALIADSNVIETGPSAVREIPWRARPSFVHTHFTDTVEFTLFVRMFARVTGVWQQRYPRAVAQQQQADVGSCRLGTQAAILSVLQFT